VVVSNSHLSDEQYAYLSGFCDKILMRENKGFDFGAWKDVILKEGWEDISQYDSLTLMNDTCFGPLFDLNKIYQEMEQKDVDFWGLTNNKNDKFGMPKTHKPILEYIQCYFICFKKNVIGSGSFKAFWGNIKYETKIEKVIQKYETQLTQILIKAGFYYSVFLNKMKFPEIDSDLAVRRPDLCIKDNVPFLKIRSFLSFPYPEYIIRLIKKSTYYPISTIFDYLNQIYDPNIMLFIQNKTIYQKNINNSKNIRTAIHLHVFYTDFLKKFVFFFNRSNADFDLYFTTDSIEKKDTINNYIKNQPCFIRLKEIIVTDNHGRDILPWLSIQDRLNKYDIVGHFHTKKSPSIEEWIGITWLNDLLYSLLYDINSIINAFYSNNTLGIIIPEIPNIFRKVFLLEYSSTLKKILNKLWRNLKCKKEINFRNIKNLIYPIGTMFWYKPDALKPLFDLKLSKDCIPKEPIPDECILHAIERLILYIAWNEGYDYRISMPAKNRGSNFIDSFNVTKILNSTEYRTGKYILASLKTIKRFIEKK
jgi:rhamnosyltransferase